MATGWSEEFCRRLDKLALEDHSYAPTYEDEHDERKLGYWHVILSDPQVECDKDHTTLKPYKSKIGYDVKRGDEHPEIHPSKQVRQRASQPFIAAVPESDHRIDPKTGWKWCSSPAT